MVIGQRSQLLEEKCVILDMDAHYDMTYFWLFVEFFVLKSMMRPGVRAF